MTENKTGRPKHCFGRPVCLSFLSKIIVAEFPPERFIVLVGQRLQVSNTENIAFLCHSDKVRQIIAAVLCIVDVALPDSHLQSSIQSGVPVANIVGIGMDRDDEMMGVLYPLGTLCHLIQIDIKLGGLQGVDLHQPQLDRRKGFQQTVLLIQKLGDMKSLKQKLLDDFLQKDLSFQHVLVAMDDSLFRV